ncbi:MAG: class I SAM-dependent methyltransferase [Gemmatimonadales bacterium]
MALPFADLKGDRLTLHVLQSKAEIAAARATLELRGLSCLIIPRPSDGVFGKLLGLTKSQAIGDVRKSWDVLRTADFIEARFPKDARVLDLGAYNSEILPVLHRMGFRRLTGIDLNPGLARMPYGEVIRWQLGDFLSAPFPDGSFDIVTAISVIEHDFDADRLMSEVSRLLVPDGCFLTSFDYWPDKILTDGIRIFDMSWTIFSRQDVQAMVERAAAHGLVPEGELTFGGGEPTIHFSDRDYTFAWIVLRKPGA